MDIGVAGQEWVNAAKNLSGIQQRFHVFLPSSVQSPKKLAHNVWLNQWRILKTYLSPEDKTLFFLITRHWL
jgi:hypothetical protein